MYACAHLCLLELRDGEAGSIKVSAARESVLAVRAVFTVAQEPAADVSEQCRFLALSLSLSLSLSVFYVYEWMKGVDDWL